MKQKNVKICEVQDFKNKSGKNFNKRISRFYVHTLANSERLIVAQLNYITHCKFCRSFYIKLSIKKQK